VGDAIDERAIFVQGPVVIFRWRNAPGWPVEFASANVSEVLGWTPDEFRSGAIGYGAILHPDDAERVGREVAERTASGATTWAHERYRVRHRDGSYRWLYDFTRVERDRTGAATHFLGYVIDITERVAVEDAARDLERRLLHAQKLESLGLLAGGVAHDFNNILTGILGQASLARRLATTPELSRALDNIEHQARRAADLTRQLLAYSGKGSFSIAPVDLGEVVRDVGSMLAVVVPKQAELRFEMAATLPAILADRAQLQQVVMNLITNAAESLVDGVGTVTVRTRTEPGPSGAVVVLEVADDGVGMSAELQAKMFDPFFTTKGTGRGLGMSVVQGIARAHRGEIRVESAPGLGTTFAVLLPATDVAVQPTAARATPAAVDRRGTILVVDDEAVIRATVAASLELLGYRVIVANDGAQALAVYDRHAEQIVSASDSVSDSASASASVSASVSVSASASASAPAPVSASVSSPRESTTNPRCTSRRPGGARPGGRLVGDLAPTRGAR
jgi:two-component system cell cycle sensor histidine kinase/response regulator CckA